MTTATEALKHELATLKALALAARELGGKTADRVQNDRRLFSEAANYDTILDLVAAIEASTSEPIGQVVACEDYGKTIRWADKAPAVGTMLFDHAAPVAALAEPDECAKCYGGDSCRFPLCRPDAEQVEVAADVHASLYGSAEPMDPMDWKLPCDVTTGAVTIRRGCKLRTLVARMNLLHQMAVASLPAVTQEQRDSFEALFKPAKSAEPARCTSCDGTGQVHRADGEWMGPCTCGAEPAPVEPAGAAVDERARALEALMGEYWDIAYREGCEGVNLGEKANDVLARFRAKLAQQAAAPGWIGVEDRLPEVGVTVMVYAPIQEGDWPGTVRISFDCIDPNDDDRASWLSHNEHYEHFCCVAKPEGSTGPSEKAPYTYWHPLPAAPTSPGEPA